jgi:hypothetical protein
MTLEEKVLAHRLFVMRRAQELLRVTDACGSSGSREPCSTAGTGATCATVPTDSSSGHPVGHGPRSRPRPPSRKWPRRRPAPRAARRPADAGRARSSSGDRTPRASDRRRDRRCPSPPRGALLAREPPRTRGRAPGGDAPPRPRLAPRGGCRVSGARAGSVGRNSATGLGRASVRARGPPGPGARSCPRGVPACRPAQRLDTGDLIPGRAPW